MDAASTEVVSFSSHPRTMPIRWCRRLCKNDGPMGSITDIEYIYLRGRRNATSSANTSSEHAPYQNCGLMLICNEKNADPKTGELKRRALMSGRRDMPETRLPKAHFLSSSSPCWRFLIRTQILSRPRRPMYRETCCNYGTPEWCLAKSSSHIMCLVVQASFLL